MKRTLASAVILSVLLPLGLSCSLNKAEKGAIIGAGAGGAVGAVVGKKTGSTVRGAIIGAAVGGAAGALIGHQMDKQAKELAYDLPGATVQRIGEGIVVTFPEGLLFAFDSDQLGSTARDNLHRFAASLEKYPNTRALIVGHTDAVGGGAYNMDLSERRASSAARFIASDGVDRARIETTGRGEAEPIASNESDSGRRLNRRIEIAIYAKDANSRGSN
jgi:outer membrane protein OmpA-like peptidoglycan-associated protein